MGNPWGTVAAAPPPFRLGDHALSQPSPSHTIVLL